MGDTAMNEQKTRAFADVARGVLIAVAFGSFALGIYQASSPAIAEVVSEPVQNTAFSVEVKASLADFVIDVAKISGVVTIIEDNTDIDGERCNLNLTSI